MSEKDTNKTDDYQRVGFRETLKIGAWTFSLFYKNHPNATIFYLIGYVLSQVSSIAYAYIFARIIDSIINSISNEASVITSLYPYLIALLAINLAEDLIHLVRNKSRTILSNNSRTFLRRELYNKLRHLGIQTLEMPETANKVTRANDHFYTIRFFLENIVDTAAGATRVLISAGLIIKFMPQLGLLIVVASIPYLAVDRIYRKKMYRFGYENTEISRKMSSIGWTLSDTNFLQEIITTSSFGFLDKLFTDFRKWYANMQIGIINSWINWESFFGLFRSFLILFGYLKIIQKALIKAISIGDVSFLFRAVDIFEGGINRTIRSINDLTEQAVRLKDIYSLFMLEPKYVPGNIKLDDLDIGPRIRFSDVSFKYPSSKKYVIKDLNLNIESGEKLAIVGPNGAGKTTLVKLISRFYPVNKGKLIINDTDINDIESGSLYKNMGTLFQDFNTYSNLSVKQNICIGLPNEKPDEVRMRLAAQTADASEFIEEYPEKFEQILSERYKGGIKPSTGQWQKIALARFFYRNAPLVIFDEPTAAIDAVSEYNIFSKIYEFFEGKTVIIISHRYSTVRNADRIIVLEKGQIVEEGTHEHLMSLDGKYAEGFRLQAEGYTD
ncbi:ABC transporter ATP-binding protein [Patescibacteria group bacterium]